MDYSSDSTPKMSNAKSNIPENVLPEFAQAILSRLDERVLIVDDTSTIRFFNDSYYNAYKKAYIDAGYNPEKILGMKISNLKGPDRNLVMSSIKRGNDLLNIFFSEDDTLYSGIANIFRISTDAFNGYAIVQSEINEMSKLCNQIQHYKQLAQDLKNELVSKDSLPLRFKQIIGVSPQFVKALKVGAQVAPTNSSVCILGESGTGKEIFAEAIHYSSNRSEGALIKINCAAIPENLIESELFGYERGAFTGANSNGNPGKFELANNGTLFLDEIGEMPLSMQVKLLRVLQEREVTRIGGHKSIKLYFRLITATNRNLEQMVENGTFREDLYYRICIIPIHLPPLRERRSDISLLANEFLSIINLPNWKTRYFSSKVLDKFMSYSWPGNIRELKNCVERMAILCPSECIESEYLPNAIANSDKVQNAFSPDISQYNLKVILKKVEYDTFRSVLSMTGSNKAKAIEILGISKRNFYLKLDEFNLR